MKYKDLIELLQPYSENKVDATLDSDTVSFWINEGETEIATIKTHE